MPASSKTWRVFGINPNVLKVMKSESPPFELPLSVHDKTTVTLTTNSWAKRHSSPFDPRSIKSVLCQLLYSANGEPKFSHFYSQLYIYGLRVLGKEKPTLFYVNNFVFLLECKENEILIRACCFIGRQFPSPKLLSRI
jgi:hypothetical protein